MRLKGSITVFMSIVLSALIAFTGIVVDASRLKNAKKHAQAAVQLSVQSALTQYHAPIKEQYGFMSTGYGKDELEALIFELVENNLSVENAYMPEYVDLYGFEVKNVTVTPFFNLTEDYVLEQQITQFMKYRAPVSTVGNFLEKLKALKTCMAQSGVLNKKMDLEKKLQKIREEQVYLSLLLAERISGFSDNGRLPDDIQKHIDIVNELVNDIENLEKPGSQLDDNWNLMLRISDEISDAKNKIRTLESEVRDLEEELAGCETGEEGDNDYIDSLIKAISAKYNEIEQQREYISSETQSFKNKADICIGLLDQISDKADTIYSSILALDIFVDRFIHYHNIAVDLADKIEKGCEAAGKLRIEIEEEIDRQSAESDNAFLMRIKAEISKLIINADPEIIRNVRAEIKNNISALETAKAKTEECKMELELIIYELYEFIYDTKNSAEDGYISSVRKTFGNRIGHMSEPVKEPLLAAAGNYKKPVYSLEPAVNQKEKEEFKKWCNSVFNEKNNVDNSKDKGYQKKLKQNIQKKEEEENNKAQEKFNGDDAGMSNRQLDELFQTLPSYKDKAGNYINVKNSDYIAEESEDNYQPANEENKNKDVEEKYSDALNENGNMASRIEKLLESAGEALIKSLYVNEYIISTFKNANEETEVFGLAGSKRQSFYEKGEVEYIIFGAKKEKTNVALAKTSVFGIRMGLNLIHVYTDTEKASAALTAANIIIGWSAFGVPIVKNLILIGWAAGESWFDVKEINAGKPVPIYKTKKTWKLDLKSIFSKIAGEVINESADWLKQTTHGLIDEGESALRTAVENIVYGAVNEAFLSVEQMFEEIDKGDGTEHEPDISGIDIPDDFGDINGLKEWIINTAQAHFDSVKSDAVNWSMLKIEEYKKKITKKIIDLLFESNAYKNLVKQLKGKIDDVINHSSELLTDKAKELGEKIEDTGIKEQILGSVVSFDYLDYLRLLLIVVPQKTKLLRISDLMQLNMKKTLDNPDFLISNYNTFLIVEAEISFRYFFIPKTIADNVGGQIKIKWGYGY